MKWRRIRAKFLAAHPWCEVHGVGVRAIEVDHRDGNPEHCAWINLRALCKTCHSRRTARDQPGGFMRP